MTHSVLTVDTQSVAKSVEGLRRMDIYFQGHQFIKTAF